MTDPIKAQKAARWDALRKQGLSAAQATAQVEQEFAGQATAPQDGGGNLASGVARAALKGATFGFNDEIAAGLSTGFGMLGDYKAERDKIRAYEEQFRDESPKAALVGELAGGFVPVTGVAQKLGMAARLLPRSTAKLVEMAAKYTGKATPTILQVAGRGMGAGAGYGALAGAGNAKEMGDVPGAAGLGALAGGVTGAVLTPIAGAASRWYAKRAAGTAGEDKVTRLANQALASSGRDAGGVGALRAQRAADEALRPGMTSLADQSDATAAMADAAVAASPAARAQFLPGLRSRLNNELGRLQDDFQQATDLTPEQLSGPATAARLEGIRKERFSGKEGAYQRWANRTDRGPYGMPMQEGTPIAEGLGSWKGWKEFGDTYANFFKGAGVEVPTVRNPSALDMQQLRMKLSDVAYGPTTGPGTRERAIEALKDLDEVLATNAGSFRTIQKNFAKQMKREEAFQAGQDYVKQGASAYPDKLEADLAKMPAWQREWTRRGIAAELAHKMGGVKDDRSIAKRVFSGTDTGTDNASRVARVAFKDTKELDAFIKKLDLEERMATTTQVGGNSLSAQRLALQEAMGKGEGLLFKTLRALGYTGPKGAAFTGLATIGAQGDPNLKRAVAERVAQGLLDPRLAKRTLDRMAKGEVEDNLRSLLMMELNPQMSGLLGQLAGSRATK